ncbi:unnamed protein product [Gordionus sp. m RMFG-2023]
MGFSWPLYKGIQFKGYKIPTPIQRKVIPLILSGKDIIATSRTGSGKTAAFLLPILQKINDNKSLKNNKRDKNIDQNEFTRNKVNGTIGSSIKAIIISPTRELAVQTFKFAKEFAKFTVVKSALILGGDSMEGQFSLLHGSAPEDLPDIIIATPGRLLHLLVEMKVGRLYNVKFLVLDEADRLLELGFAPQISSLVQEHLPSQASCSSFSLRQTLLFSATFSSQMASNFTSSVETSSIFPDLPSPFVFVKCDAEYRMSPELSLQFLACKGTNQLHSGDGTDKIHCLFRLIESFISENSNKQSPKEKEVVGNIFKNSFPDRRPAANSIFNENSDINDKNTKKYSIDDDNKHFGLDAQKGDKKWKILVFLPTKYHVDYIRELILARLGIECTYVYSSLDASARKTNISKFREGISEIMLVTDIAARGLDIPLLDCVINFTFPSSPKLFLHRVGRVARAGNKGTAYSLISHQELPHVYDFLNFIGHDLLYYRAGMGSLDEITQERHDQGLTRSFHLFGSIPDHLNSFSDYKVTDNANSIDKNDYNLSNLAAVCDRALLKFLKSQTRPTNEAIKRLKEEYLNKGGALMLRAHPIFVDQDENAERADDKLRFLAQLKNFKKNCQNNKNIAFPNLTTQSQKPRKSVKRSISLHFPRNTVAPILNYTATRGKFANPACFVPYAPQNNVIQKAEDHVLDIGYDDGTTPRNTKNERKGIKEKMVWDSKRKRFVNANDLKSNRKKQKIVNESGVRVLGSRSKPEIYLNWLKKTNGGSALYCQLNDNAPNKQSDQNYEADNDETNEIETLGNRKRVLNNDWRNRPKFRGSFNNVLKCNKPNFSKNFGNRKSKLSSKNKGGPERALGLRKPEQVFKERYKKEKKQAFANYRKNINASKHQKKSKGKL